VGIEFAADGLVTRKKAGGGSESWDEVGLNSDAEFFVWLQAEGTRNDTFALIMYLG